MEEQALTVKDVLIRTAEILNNICVPVAYKGAIADPIYSAIKNLEVCVSSIAEKEEEDAKTDAE